mgnify:CR=1 FL=1
MRLGRPLAAASAVAAMTGASLIASPVLANSSNSNSSSTPSSTAEATTPPGKPAQPSPAPSKTGEATPAPGKTAAGSSFKITQEKTFASSSTNTSFTISGTGCTGKQATVGIALYAPDGSVSDVVKTEAAADGSWTSDLDLAALIKSIGTTTATTTDGWTIGAGCMTYGDKTEMTQVTKQQQTQIYFDDTRISGSYEVSARTESQSQTFTFHAQGFYASEKVTVLLRSKSDSSVSYTLGELTVDANGNLTGNLPAPTDAPDGEYVLVLTGSHHSETATSQTVTTVSQHTFTIASSERSTTETETSEQKTTENNGGGDKTSEQKTTERSTSERQNSEQNTTERSTSERQSTEQKTTEQNTTERSASENNGGGNKQAGGDKTTEQKASEKKTTENNGGGNNGGSNSNANAGSDKQAGGDKQAKADENKAGENKAGADKAGADKGNNLSSNAKDSSSENRAGGETTKDSDGSLARTGANGMLFGGIAAFLVVAGGTALVLRRRNKA